MTLRERCLDILESLPLVLVANYSGEETPVSTANTVLILIVFWVSLGAIAVFVAWLKVEYWTRTEDDPHGR